MNMDRNTVIGFVLLALLLFGYLFISTKNSHELQAKKQKTDDSLALVKRVRDSIALANDTTAKIRKSWFKRTSLPAALKN